MEGEDKVVHLARSLKVSSKQTRPRMNGHEITKIHVESQVTATGKELSSL